MGFESNRKIWTALAESDPLWAILSDPSKRGNRWEIEEIFRTGRETIEAEMASILEVYPELEFGKALDFGCGVGRLSLALGARFESVVGIDVAPRMIELATMYNRTPERIAYRLNQRPDLSFFDSESFDFVLSLISLQHIDPASILAYLSEFMRVLRPGGVAYFQLPARRRVKGGALSVLARRIGRALSPQPRYEMNCVAQDVVESLIQSSGGEILRARQNEAGGPKYESLDYLARKR